MPARSSIDRFLALPRIAFVGVARDPNEFANTVYRALRRPGRTLVPVNAHAAGGPIEGDPSSPSLAEAPEVDGVLVMVPRDQAGAVVDEAVARGIHHIWLHAGLGSSCVAPDAVERARRAGADVVDGACPLMFLEPVRGFHRLHRALTRRIA